MRQDNLHDVLWDFCKGLGSTRTVDVSNGTYVAKRLLNLKMPDDYEPEANRAVFSPKVTRQLYLIHWRELAEGGLNAQNNGSRAFRLGGLLKKVHRDNRDKIRLVALDLAYRKDRRKDFTEGETETAREAAEAIRSLARDQGLLPGEHRRSRCSKGGAHGGARRAATE